MAKFKAGAMPEISEFKDRLKIGIVTTEWNADIIKRMENSCLKELKNQGINDDQIETLVVPGAFELPWGAKLLMEHGRLDAVICLGCVIKGETTHDEHINRSVSGALMQLGLMTDKPVVFGILTTLDHAQAEARSGGVKGDKGGESALTALKMIAIKNKLSKGKKKIGF